jgi:hypothetical protein
VLLHDQHPRTKPTLYLRSTVGNGFVPPRLA